MERTFHEELMLHASVDHFYERQRMSQQRRHPQRHVEGKRVTKEWGKSGKNLMHEQRIARRVANEIDASYRRGCWKINHRRADGTTETEWRCP